MNQQDLKSVVEEATQGLVRALYGVEEDYYPRGDHMQYVERAHQAETALRGIRLLCDAGLKYLELLPKGRP